MAAGVSYIVTGVMPAGGTLYLGVSDQGTVTSVENDMKYLKLSTIDSYMRYVQDKAKKYFGIDTLPYLRIEPLYDNTVVAIHVDPHPYRVVEPYRKNVVLCGKS